MSLRLHQVYIIFVEITMLVTLLAFKIVLFVFNHPPPLTAFRLQSPVFVHFCPWSVWSNLTSRLGQFRPASEHFAVAILGPLLKYDNFDVNKMVKKFYQLRLYETCGACRADRHLLHDYGTVILL